MRRWIIIIILIYLAGGIGLYYLQDAILFHPVQVKRSGKLDITEPHEEFSIPLNNEDNLHLVHFKNQTDTSRGAVLYFHGNKKNISWYAKHTPVFTNNGYEVFMIDYPGYGKSTGKFTEQILYDWARHVYNFARSRFPADSIIIYGKSMGTGIASWLASREQCKRLILETPYYDLPSVIKQYLPIYPIKKILHYELPTWRYLSIVDEPITIIHGTRDGVIKYKNSKRLSPFLKPTDEFITVEGASHNDLYDYPLTKQKMDSLLGL